MDDEIREEGEELDGADEVAETDDESDAGLAGEEGADDLSEEGGADDLEEGVEEYNGEIGSYEITGLVDIFDEQNNITGQFPIGSVQELPAEYGDRMVDEGNATRVE